MEEPSSNSNAAFTFSNLESLGDPLFPESHRHDDKEYSSGLATSAVSCLICGSQFVPSSVVKQEPAEEDGGIVPVQVEEVACNTKWEEEEVLMFQWLIMWQNVKVKRLKWDTVTEPFPFCGGCKSRLALLLDIRRKIDELEERLKGGIVELREKMIASEVDVQLSGIYLRDERYLKLRGQVTNGVEQGVSRREKNAKKTKPGYPKRRKTPNTGNSDDKVAPLRKSERAPKPIERLQTTSFSEFLPVVRLSAEDKARAEELQDGNELKIEIEADPAVSRKQTKVLGKRNGSDSDVRAFTSDIDGQKLITSDEPSASKRRRRVKAEMNYMEDDDAYGDFLFDGTEDPVTEDDNWSPEKDFGRSSSGKEVKQRNRKKNSRKKNFKLQENSDDDVDADFVPDEDGSGTDSDGLEDDDNLKANEWLLPEGRKHSKHKKPEFLKEDPTTGVVIYSDIQFSPVQNETDKYSCGKCSRIIKKSLSNFRSHAMRMHTDRAVCSFCNFRGVFKSELRRHMKIVHENGGRDRKRRERTIFECDICGKIILYSQSMLKRHRYTHYSEQDKLEAIARGEKVVLPMETKVIHRFQCEDCGKKFGGTNNLERHKLSVHGSEEEKRKASELCSVCGKSVLSFRLRRHMKDDHPAVPERYSCLKCDRIFTTKTKLRLHKRVHQERPFKCELCGKGFVTQESFTGHMNLHNDIRPFKCEYCSLAFATKKMIMKHTKAFHTAGSKPRRAPYLRGLGKSSRVGVEKNDCEESE